MHRFLIKRIFGWFLVAMWIVAQCLLFTEKFLSIKYSPNFVTARASMGAISLGISRGSSRLILFNCALIIIPMCRYTITRLSNSKWLWFIPFEWCTDVHRIIAFTVVGLSLIHAAAHAVNFGNYEQRVIPTVSALHLIYTTGASITGQILMLLLFIIVVTSAFKAIRQVNFELFQYTHYLWILFMTVASFHGAFCFIKRDIQPHCVRPSFYYWWLPSGIIYCAEWAVKEYFSQRQTIQVRKVVLHPSKVLEIQLDYNPAYFTYKPGQYVRLKCKKISFFQWHPFTLTSSPNESFISVHLRIVGNWTRKLAQLYGVEEENQRLLNDGLINIPDSFSHLRIDGPYGDACEFIYHYKIIVLIGAGIGQTPFASILKSIWYQHLHTNNQQLMETVYFYAIGRETQTFEWFHELLQKLEKEDFQSFFKIYTFLTTKDFNENQVKNIMINDMEGICDAITGLRTPTRFGRPDFHSILQQLSSAHHDQTIGVFYCGPHSLAVELSTCCSKFSNIQYYFEEF